MCVVVITGSGARMKRVSTDVTQEGDNGESDEDQKDTDEGGLMVVANSEATRKASSDAELARLYFTSAHGATVKTGLAELRRHEKTVVAGALAMGKVLVELSKCTTKKNFYAFTHHLVYSTRFVGATMALARLDDPRWKVMQRNEHDATYSLSHTQIVSCAGLPDQPRHVQPTPSGVGVAGTQSAQCGYEKVTLLIARRSHKSKG